MICNRYILHVIGYDFLTCGVVCLYSTYYRGTLPCHCFIFTDAENEAENETENDNIVVPILIAIAVVLLSGAIITVVVYIMVKRFRKQRKSAAVSSGEMTLRSPNLYSTASPGDVPNNFRERKVNMNTFLFARVTQ